MALHSEVQLGGGVGVKSHIWIQGQLQLLSLQQIFTKQPPRAGTVPKQI